MSDAIESTPCSDCVGTTRDARKRSPHVPAMERVKGLDRKGFAFTKELDRYNGGRKSGPVAWSQLIIAISISPSTNLLWLASAAPEKRLAAEAKRSRSWGKGLVMSFCRST